MWVFLIDSRPVSFGIRMVMLKTAVAAIAPWGPRTPNRTFYKKIIMQIFAYYFLVDPKY